MNYKAKSLEKVDLPKGHYDGFWGGYVATVLGVSPPIEVKVDVGVRCIRCSCNITVKEDGYLYVN